MVVGAGSGSQIDHLPQIVCHQLELHLQGVAPQTPVTDPPVPVAPFQGSEHLFHQPPPGTYQITTASPSGGALPLLTSQDSLP